MNFFFNKKAVGLVRPAAYLLLLLLGVTACETDTVDAEIPQSQEGVAPTAPNQLMGLLNEAEDGMLAFASFDAFSAALDAVAPLTTEALSERELRDIEQRLGVETMQGNYLLLVEQYDSDVELPSTWLAKNNTTVLPFDGGLSATIADVAFRTLINKEGKVKVGSDVYLYTDDYVLIAKNDPDPSLIDDAISTTSSNFDAGIFIIEDWQQGVDDLQQRCGGGSSRGCTAPEMNDHRVRGDWGFTSNPQIIENTTCFGSGPGQFCTVTSITYIIRPKYFANAKVEDRGWFNRWTRDQTRLSFTCGVRASGLSGSGTGWTSNSRIHEINVSWSAGPTTVNTFPAGSGQVPAGLFRTLDYVTGGVDDEEISGLFCFGCCPWDCADADESDIP